MVFSIRFGLILLLLCGMVYVMCCFVAVQCPFICDLFFCSFFLFRSLFYILSLSVSFAGLFFFIFCVLLFWLFVIVFVFRLRFLLHIRYNHNWELFAGHVCLFVYRNEWCTLRFCLKTFTQSLTRLTKENTNCTTHMIIITRKIASNVKYEWIGHYLYLHWRHVYQIISLFHVSCLIVLTLGRPMWIFVTFGGCFVV